MPGAILESLATKPVILDRELGRDEIASVQHYFRVQYNMKTPRSCWEKCSLQVDIGHGFN